MTKRFIPFAFVCVLLCTQPSSASDQKAGFPEIKGWKLSVEETVYTPNNLWDVIDGAADLFLEYNFVDLQIGRYHKSPDLEIKVELYRHKTPTDAFGMYSQERYPDYHYIDLGVQGYHEKGALNFLAGRFYVKVTTIQTGTVAEDALVMVAQKVEESLRQERSWPVLLGAFPSDGKQRNSEQYVAKSFLGYSFLNRAYVASYERGTAFKAFVIRSETAEAAQSLVTEYLKHLDSSRVTRFPAGRVQALDPHNGKVDFVLSGDLFYGVYGEAERNDNAKFLNDFGKNLSSAK